jgi:hypothetical protein
MEQDKYKIGPKAPPPADTASTAPDGERTSRRQFLRKAATTTAYVAPVVVTLGSARTAAAAGTYST